MIVVGEVETGLLQHSHALSAATVTELLTLPAGETARHSARPLSQGTSPQILTGLDCPLTSQGRATRAVGTAMARALITGGHVIQGSAFTRINPQAFERRMPWSHYLARPGELQIIGSGDASRCAEGFADHDPGTGALNLGAISNRTINRIHRSPRLDRRTPFPVQRTRLRWIARHHDDAPAAQLVITDSPLRILRINTSAIDAVAVAQLSEDIAVHDWLLTTALALLERTGIGSRQRPEVIRRLEPIVDHLLPLWMPATRIDPRLAKVWQILEATPGFTRQWTNIVARIRDQLSVAAAYARAAIHPALNRL